MMKRIQTRTLTNQGESMWFRSTDVQIFWSPVLTWSTLSGRGVQLLGFTLCRSPVQSFQSPWFFYRVAKRRSGCSATSGSPGSWVTATASLSSRWLWPKWSEGRATDGHWWRKRSSTQGVEGSSACVSPPMINSTSTPTWATSCPHRCRMQVPWQHLCPWRCCWSSPGWQMKKWATRNHRGHWRMLKYHQTVLLLQSLLLRHHLLLFHLFLNAYHLLPQPFQPLLLVHHHHPLLFLLLITELLLPSPLLILLHHLHLSLKGSL